MNNNVNNNQEMILREKIEKREKFDTILAYILLVIILGCIGVVLGLKFLGGDEEETPVDEYTPTYISLDDIATSLNSSVLANRYMNDGASFATTVNGNALLVNYVKDDVNLNMDMPVVGNELMINMPVDNKEIRIEIYEEIANIICMYYGNEEKNCRYTVDNLDGNDTDGIRFDKNGTVDIIYIDVTKSYSVNKNVVYNDVTLLEINNFDYILELYEVRISDINIVSSETDIIFRGNVEIVNDENFNFDVVVKLYNSNGELLNENKYTYNNENILDGSDVFEVSFAFDDSLKLENINKYSIEIIK